MDKAQKQAFIEGFRSSVADAVTLVVGEYRGLTVADMTNLRNQLRKQGGAVKVTKNRLAQIALRGTVFEGSINSLLVGPTVVAYSKDPVAAAKVAHEFAKTNDKFIIKGGALGEKALDKAAVQALASLPSLPEVRAKLVGLLQAPATRLATYSQEPAAKIARVLQARGQQAA